MVLTAGKTYGMRYFVGTEWVRGAKLVRKTTLTRITRHCLSALIVEDLTRYQNKSLHLN